MKYLVTVKRVTDYEAKIRLKPDRSGIVTDGVNMIVNPFDEIGVEEALRLKEKHGGDVVVLSIGGNDATQQIRSALAMGADRGILVKHDGPLDSNGVARIVQKVVEKESPDVVIMGKQAIDDDSNQAGQLLAEYLGTALIFMMTVEMVVMALFRGTRGLFTGCAAGDTPEPPEPDPDLAIRALALGGVQRRMQMYDAVSRAHEPLRAEEHTAEPVAPLRVGGRAALRPGDEDVGRRKWRAIVVGDDAGQAPHQVAAHVGEG